MQQNARNWRPVILDPQKDKETILAARELFFGRREDAYLEWLYYHNPAGTVYCAMAMDGEKLAGQYIVIPVKLWLNGREVEASMSLDTITHPDYRKQGVFTGLAEELYARILQDGLRLTYGFPNPNSRPGMVGRLKFSEPMRVDNMVRPLSPVGGVPLSVKQVSALIPSGLISMGFSAKRRLVWYETDSPDREWVDALWRRCRNKIRIGQLKDADWTKWRYEDNPCHRYRFLLASTPGGSPEGYAVWDRETHPGKHRRRNLRLMDVMAVDYSVRVSIIGEMLRRAAGKAEAIRYFATRFSKEWFAMVGSGFIPLREMVFVLREHAERGELPRLNRGTWPISSCDMDTV